MADAGLDDVLVTYNVVGAGKLERLRALLRRIDVTVSVDDAPSVALFGDGGRRARRTAGPCRLRHRARPHGRRDPGASSRARSRDREVRRAPVSRLHHVSGTSRDGVVLEAPRSTIERLNEEHAVVALADGELLELGQRVSVVPNHACVVANLFDELVVVGRGRESTIWRVDARGRSR
jgi:D-serine deaminase-like pyridoxal phosphate-dependent protein